MPTFRNPLKGDFVHYVLPSNAHRPGIVVRVMQPIDDAKMPLVDLVVFMDGRNDITDHLLIRNAGLGMPVPTIWVEQINYEMSAGIRSWHWPDECANHEFD